MIKELNEYSLAECRVLEGGGVGGAGEREAGAGPVGLLVEFGFCPQGM